MSEEINYLNLEELIQLAEKVRFWGKAGRISYQGVVDQIIVSLSLVDSGGYRIKKNIEDDSYDFSAIRGQFLIGHVFGTKDVRVRELYLRVKREVNQVMSTEEQRRREINQSLNYAREILQGGSNAARS